MARTHLFDPFSLFWCKAKVSKRIKNKENKNYNFGGVDWIFDWISKLKRPDAVVEDAVVGDAVANDAVVEDAVVEDAVIKEQ